MIKDKIKQNNDYKQSLMSCLSCKKSTHTLDKCPMLHFVPDSLFIINRFLYSAEQTRDPSFIRKNNKKKLNALYNNELIQSKVFLLDSCLFSECSDESENVYKSDENLHEHKSFEKLDIIEDVNEEDEGEEKEKEINKVNLPKFPTNEMMDIKIPHEKSQTEVKSAKLRKKDSIPLELREFKITESSKKESPTLTSLERLPTIYVGKQASHNKEIEENYNKELFLFSFDCIKTYETYFPEGNAKIIIGKINEKISSSPMAMSIASRQSFKKKFRKKIMSSKFFINSSFKN